MSHEHHHGSPGEHHQTAPIASAFTAAAVRRVFVITLILNIAVASAKGGYGLLTGSIALGSDAIHAVLDASSNVLALVSLRLARVPADDRHPYGRQKIKILAAVGIGVLIVFGLVELSEAAIRSLIGKASAPHICWE